MNDDVEQKAAFAKAAFGDFQHNINNVNNAAGVIIVSYRNGLIGHDPQGNVATSKGDSWSMFDVGIAGQTLSLAFHEKGTMFVYDFEEGVRVHGYETKDVLIHIII
ncbi:MAG: hypothetical protein JJD95_13690 [Clostridium sp.]|nr:hypothetical protein [Clostridium sp.]